MPHKDGSSFYRRTLSDSFRLAWRHKHLWTFGFFATFLGFGGVYDVIINLYDKSAETLPQAAALASPMQLVPGYATLRVLTQFSPYPALTVIMFLVLGILIFGVFAWFTLASVGALIGSVRKIQQGGDPHFADGIKIGAARFWTLLGVNLFAKAVTYLAFFLTGVNLYSLLTNRADATGAVFYVGSFTAFTIVAVIASLTAIYGSNFAVLKNTTVTESLDRGWNLLKKHWLVSLEMTLILFVANLAVGLLAIVAFLVAVVPLFFLLLLGALVQAQALTSSMFMLTAITAIVIAVLFASYYTTVQVSAWTLLWSELTEKKPVSIFFRLAQRLRNK
jgi:hypothetical protein